MREGSLDAPTRHPIKWKDADFWDEGKLYEELERVFDICHGCRRCFNLCDSFPLLFDMVDESPSGELDTVDKKEYKKVVDACTLCDMCFLTKCPYVPPHEFDLDFPHLMVRARAQMLKKGLRTSLNTDDPGVFGITLNDEYLHAIEYFNPSLAQLGELNLNAIDMAFTDNQTKQDLKNRIQEAYECGE